VGGISWDQASRRLLAAVANLGSVLSRSLLDDACPLEFPPDLPWLVVSGQLEDPRDFRASGGLGPLPARWVPYPFERPANGEYLLNQLFRSKAADHVDAGFWKREVVDPMKEHAKRLGACLDGLQSRALRGTLSDTARKALRALHALKAFDQETRTTIDKVAREAEGKQHANASPYREEIPSLVKALLAKSLAHRGGGVWLTPEGRTLAKSLPKRR
jgi:hypothetical protein